MKCPVCNINKRSRTRRGAVYSYTKGLVRCPRCFGTGHVKTPKRKAQP